MKKWQRCWLYLVIFYAALHLVRDIFQDLGIKTWLSTILMKNGEPKPIYPLYWAVFNTYVFGSLEIGLAMVCFRKNQFDKIGYLTIVIAAVILVAWLFYWFFL